MATAPIFKGASGGKSDDRFIGIVDSFQDSSNIEIRKNPRGITLTKKLVKDSGNVITEIINCFLQVSNGNIMAFGQSGGVYRKVNGSWFKNSNTLGTAILSCTEFNGFVYFTTTSNLYRVAVGSLSNSMSFSPFATLKTTDRHPMLTYYSDTLFIGNKDTISIVNDDGVFEESYIEVNSNINVKFISGLGSNLKIYCEYSNFNKTEILFYSKQSENLIVSDSFTLDGIIIDQLASKQGIDYIITKGQFGIINGYEQIKFKDLDDYTKNISGMTPKGNRLYFGGNNKVWEWGALNKNYPEVLSNSYSPSEGGEVGAIFAIGDDLYVSWKNGASYGIDKLSNNFNEVGYITTRTYYGESRTDRKGNIGVKMSFNKIIGNDKIKIYVAKDLGNFTLFRELTSNGDKQNDFLDIQMLTGDWNFIEFKIELISGNGTTTPEFYELFLSLNDIKRGN